MLLGVLQFSRPPAVDSLSVTEAYHQLVGPKGLVNAETGQVLLKSFCDPTASGRPFFSESSYQALQPIKGALLGGTYPSATSLTLASSKANYVSDSQTLPSSVALRAAACSMAISASSSCGHRIGEEYTSKI
jgi:hypothetical protein